MNIEDLQAYHKHITNTYDERSGRHDNSQWHRETALKLITDKDIWNDISMYYIYAYK